MERVARTAPIIRCLAGFNDLATAGLPDIAADEWSDRNEKIIPTQVTAFANRKAWWKCRDCGHESGTPLFLPAPAEASARVAVATPSTKGRLTICRQHTRRLLRSGRRRTCPLKPDEVNAKSRKNVWWQCREMRQ